MRVESSEVGYRGTLLIRNFPHIGPYSRTVSRAPWRSQGGGQLLMSEIFLYGKLSPTPLSFLFQNEGIKRV